MITSVARERTFHLKGVGMITYDHRCSQGEDVSSEAGGDDYL